MKWTLRDWLQAAFVVFVIIVACVAIGLFVYSCSTAASPPPEPQIPTPLKYLQSACDAFGNRVYIRSGSGQSLAVVGQDPTCKR